MLVNHSRAAFPSVAFALYCRYPTTPQPKAADSAGYETGDVVGLVGDVRALVLEVTGGRGQVPGAPQTDPRPRPMAPFESLRAPGGPETYTRVAAARWWWLMPHLSACRS